MLPFSLPAAVQTVGIQTDRLHLAGLAATDLRVRDPSQHLRRGVRAERDAEAAVLPVPVPELQRPGDHQRADPHHSNQPHPGVAQLI